MSFPKHAEISIFSVTRGLLNRENFGYVVPYHPVLDHDALSMVETIDCYARTFAALEQHEVSAVRLVRARHTPLAALAAHFARK